MRRPWRPPPLELADFRRVVRPVIERAAVYEGLYAVGAPVLNGTFR